MEISRYDRRICECKFLKVRHTTTRPMPTYISIFLLNNCIYEDISTRLIKKFGVRCTLYMSTVVSLPSVLVIPENVCTPPQVASILLSPPPPPPNTLLPPLAIPFNIPHLRDVHLLILQSKIILQRAIENKSHK